MLHGHADSSGWLVLTLAPSTGFSHLWLWHWPWLSLALAGIAVGWAGWRNFCHRRKCITPMRCRGAVDERRRARDRRRTSRLHAAGPWTLHMEELHTLCCILTMNTTHSRENGAGNVWKAGSHRGREARAQRAAGRVFSSLRRSPC